MWWREDDFNREKYVILVKYFAGCGPRSGGAVGDQLHAKDLVYSKELSTVPPVKHMVYAGIFPADQSQHVMLSDSIKKLALNDSAVTVTADSR